MILEASPLVPLQQLCLWHSLLPPSVYSSSAVVVPFVLSVCDITSLLHLSHSSRCHCCYDIVVVITAVSTDKLPCFIVLIIYL